MKTNTHILLALAFGLLFCLPSCKKETTPTPYVPFNCATYASITTNTTLPAGVDTVTCNIEVSNNATFTISPGTTLIFSQGAMLTVDAGASINATGTAANPIVFRGLDTTAGYWIGLNINSISTANVFTYCTIRDGGAAQGNKFGANVSLTGTASFTNCNILNSVDAGLYVFGNNVNSPASDDAAKFNSFTNNAVNNNGSYPIATYAVCAGTIGAGNTFTGNADNYIGIRSEGGVTANVTLGPLAVPYEILQLSGTDAGLQVANTLTIAPGTTIVMASATSIYTTSTGTINATGTSTSPITVKGLQATTGFWGTLAVSSNNANIFEYCNVSGGGGLASFDIYSNNKGLIGTYMYIPVARTLTVRNCNLSNSGSSGIYVSPDAPAITPTYNSDISTSNTFTGCSPNVQM